MVLKGGDTIHAPRKKVRDFPTAPNQIGQCVPGVGKIETVTELKKYRGIKSVKACSNGDIKILELDQPNRAKLKAHSTATDSGADAVSEMHLSDGPDGSTRVQWTAGINLSSPLASLARRAHGSINHARRGGLASKTGSAAGRA
jgi:carbon monoxide dehydrogenase subunit G